MNSRKGIGAVLLTCLVATPAAMAHDPKEHEREAKEMKRVPVQIHPAPVLELPRELPKIRFEEMDRNGDRRITRKEWRGKGSSFRKHDRNKDGVLSGIEVAIPSKPVAK